MSTDTDGRTHWEGCWRDPKHHACAVVEVERLQNNIEMLVMQEVISASRAREVHGLTLEQQRQLWKERYESVRKT